MSAKRSLCSAIALLGWLGCAASAQEGVRWQPTLETARRLAEQTNRLVLIHFWGDGCPPCMMMERDVFPRADVAAALEGSFVPVKINRSHFPATAAQFGISVVPADVIITPQGQVLDKQAGFLPAEQYIGLVTQVAAKWRSGGITQYAQMTPGQPAVTTGRVVARYDMPTATDPRVGAGAGMAAQEVADQTLSTYPQPEAAVMGPRYATQGASSYPWPSSAPPAARPTDMAQTSPPGQAVYPQNSPLTGYSANPSDATQTIRIPEGNPPLAMDGFCPVLLKETERWVSGNPRWGLRHEGRTYLFAGPEEQRRFFEQPELYAPVLSGNDIVMAVEQGQSASGKREFGAWYKSRVYLFSSDDSFRKFAGSPQRYADAVGTLGQTSPGMANRAAAGGRY